MPFNSLLFEGPKSALPPINPGVDLAIAFNICPLLSRVATPFPASKTGHSIFEKSGFKS
jgi:hypothetical protein